MSEKFLASKDQQLLSKNQPNSDRRCISVDLNKEGTDKGAIKGPHSSIDSTIFTSQDRSMYSKKDFEEANSDNQKHIDDNGIQIDQKKYNVNYENKNFELNDDSVCQTGDNSNSNQRNIFLENSNKEIENKPGIIHPKNEQYLIPISSNIKKQPGKTPGNIYVERHQHLSQLLSSSDPIKTTRKTPTSNQNNPVLFQEPTHADFKNFPSELNFNSNNYDNNSNQRDATDFYGNFEANSQISSNTVIQPGNDQFQEFHSVTQTKNVNPEYQKTLTPVGSNLESLHTTSHSSPFVVANQGFDANSGFYKQNVSQNMRYLAPRGSRDNSLNCAGYDRRENFDNRQNVQMQQVQRILKREGYDKTQSGSANVGNLQRQEQYTYQSKNNQNMPDNSNVQNDHERQLMRQSLGKETSMKRMEAMNQYRQEYQKRLVLLLHANKCMKRQENNAQVSDCRLPHCASMKKILNHVGMCRLGRDCKVPHCFSSRQIISHWKNCKNPTCPHCMPLKAGGDKKNMAPPPEDEEAFKVDIRFTETSDEFSLPGACSIGACIRGRIVGVYDDNNIYYRLLQPKVKHVWHNELPPKLRHYFVDKLISAVLPTPVSAILTNRRAMENLFVFAQEVEVEMFEQADSQNEYYHMLAEKIYKISKQLECRRKEIHDSKIETTESNAVSSKNDVSLPQPEIKIKVKLEKNSLVPTVKMDPQPGDLSRVKVFDTAEMRIELHRIIEKIFKEEDSELFRAPVDAKDVTDYYSVIKDPMDLSTMKTKCDNGQYNDIWNFISDFRRIFENAWLYNKKSTHVYKKAIKLDQIFSQEGGKLMKHLGYCCSHYHVYKAKPMVCFGKVGCNIPRHGAYFTFENRINYCEKCFKAAEGSFIKYDDESNSVQTLISNNSKKIPKKDFEKKKNDAIDHEVMLECTVCKRSLHQICVMYSELTHSQPFVCKTCCSLYDLKPSDTNISGTKLQSTRMGTYLENRLNNFIKKQENPVEPIIVRVVGITERVVEVKPGMKERFCKEDGEKMPDKFPYTCKVVFISQVIDSHEVFLFGMHVQEYGSDCPPPNRGISYLSYLDSVQFFKPAEYRSNFYHEILIGYMDYIKLLGFHQVRFWACPPCEGDDYIFHCHPLSQKVPKQKRLVEWYSKMLDKAILEQVVVEYCDLLKDSMDNKITSAAQMPYFDGDYWPNVIEESIKSVVADENKLLVKPEKTLGADLQDSESEEYVPENPPKPKFPKMRKSKKKVAKPKKSTGPKGDLLFTKLLSNMEKLREAFFCIYLVPRGKNKRERDKEMKSISITDPDPTIPCELMDGRDNFLGMCRDRHMEFSSLRRAKFSTLITNYELMSQGAFYNCNRCRANIETRYHCTECSDYDLCVICFKIVGHVHEMIKKTSLDSSMEDKFDDNNVSENGRPLTREETVLRLAKTLGHSAICRDSNCRHVGCPKLRNSISHFKRCGEKGNDGTCADCRRYVYLVYFHTRECKEEDCTVPKCEELKARYQYRVNTQRVQSDCLAQRRAADMHRRIKTGDVTTKKASNNNSEKSLVKAETPKSTNTSFANTSIASNATINESVISIPPVDSFSQRRRSFTNLEDTSMSNLSMSSFEMKPMDMGDYCVAHIQNHIHPGLINQLGSIISQYTGEKQKEVLSNFLRKYPVVLNFYVGAVASGMPSNDRTTLEIYRAITQIGVIRSKLSSFEPNKRRNNTTNMMHNQDYHNQMVRRHPNRMDNSRRLYRPNMQRGGIYSNERFTSPQYMHKSPHSVPRHSPMSQSNLLSPRYMSYNNNPSLPPQHSRTSPISMPRPNEGYCPTPTQITQSPRQRLNLHNIRMPNNTKNQDDEFNPILSGNNRPPTDDESTNDMKEKMDRYLDNL